MYNHLLPFRHLVLNTLFILYLCSGVRTSLESTWIQDFLMYIDPWMLTVLARFVSMMAGLPSIEIRDWLACQIPLWSLEQVYPMQAISLCCAYLTTLFCYMHVATKKHYLYLKENTYKQTQKLNWNVRPSYIPMLNTWTCTNISKCQFWEQTALL